MDKKQDEVREHSFDGIQEYDNQLPKWWIGTFVMTVVFGFCYWLYYQTYQVGPNQQQEFERNMSQHISQFKGVSSGGAEDGEILTLVKDGQTLDAAKKIFAANCMACHGENGQGVIGPNLTDRYWIHGGKPSQIFATIQNGVPEKGMVPWKGILTNNQTKQVVAYILSLKDSNPAGAKEPQGELVE